MRGREIREIPRATAGTAPAVAARMSLASPVIPGTTWELTRRCKDRMFLLRPDADVVKAFLYCLAYCAEKHGMLLHVLSLMLNHYHDSLTDVLGRRVDFVWELHSMVALCIKRMRGEDGEDLDGAVWDPNEATGRVLLASDEGMIDSFAYILANPVAAGLVRSLADWPSFVSKPEWMLENRTITIKRPACLDGEADALRYPKTATLRFCVPPAQRDNARAFVRAVEERLAQRIEEAHKDKRQSGVPYPSPEQLVNVSPFDKPKTPRKKNNIKPTFRAVTKEAIARAKRQLRAWRRAYRCAFEAFRDGNRAVEWPAGTWWFARYGGVNVAPLDDWATRLALS